MFSFDSCVLLSICQFAVGKHYVDSYQLVRISTRLIGGEVLVGNNAEFVVVKKLVFYLMTGLVLLSVCQSAVGKGKTRYGLGLNVASLSVDDPEGDNTGSGSTESEVVTYFSGIMTTPINRNNQTLRLWYELKYRRFSLEPTTVAVGQDVRSLSVSVTAQTAWSTQNIGAYWVGVGGELGFDEFTNRTTVDQDGFLAQSFSDRKETNIGLLLNAGLNSRKTKGGYFVGLNVNSHVSLTDGIDGVSMTAFVLW